VFGAAYALYRYGFYHVGEEAVPAPGEMEGRVAYREAMEKDDAELAAAPYERVQITADDGTPLVGRYYHRADGAPLAIIFHGYKGYAARDGLGGYILCKNLGYNVLLPDQRCHGDSGGHVITMGVKERYDCRAWTYWARRRFGADVRIALMGVSMGAATVLLASGLDLPENVRAIVADCGYTSPTDIAMKCLPEFFPQVPAGLAYNVGRLGAEIYGHFDPKDADCRLAVSKTKIPILFIHGEADDFVPCEMSRENYAVCASEKQLLTIPGAKHAVCYYHDTPAYTKAVTEFFGKYM